MCGLAGFLDTARRWGEADLLARAQAMGASLQLRGPDDHGAFAAPEWGLALGFRRLSILDLSEAGRQPMRAAGGRWVIAFNGEIYNADDLRAELSATGVRFRGHSDTEVLLEACALWGVERTLPKLIGMFAFAAADLEGRTLWLARDRLGVKPLYYGRFGASVLFASQPKALFAHPDFAPTLDPEALAAYVRFGYVPQPRAIYAGLRTLGAGCFAQINAQGAIDEQPYWRAAEVALHAAPLEGSDDNLLSQLDGLLRDAVRRRMVADVPLGAFLSGGIDSSLVVALMQAQSARPVKTFSIGFSEAAYDEAPHAKRVAAHLGAEHHEFYVSPRDALDVIPELADIYDEPFADSSQIPTFLVSRLARAHVTVALSGDGGDELFAGYARYGQMAKLARLAPFAAGARLARGLLTNEAARALFPPVMRARGDRWLSRIGALEGAEGFARAYRALVQAGPEPGDYLSNAHEQPNAIWRDGQSMFETPIARCQIIDTLTYLPDDILVKVDRASMAASLEAREPLLDHRLFEFSWRLPNRMRVRNGEQKWALRHLLYRYVPRAIVDRPKMGFGVPIEHWLRGPLRDWAEDLLNARGLSQEGVFKPDAVRALWARHLEGENWQFQLWTLLMFQAWRRRWLDQPAALSHTAA